MEKDEQALITAFKTNREYFKLLRNQRLNSALTEPEVIDLILNNAKGNVLDAGCGEGTFIKWISRKLPKLNTYGVDISEIGIKMAKEESAVDFLSADLKNLPFADNFFDLIYCQSVIEHIVKYEDALEELYRVLKVDGKLIIRVGNGAHHGKKLTSVFFDTVLNRNTVIKLSPTCTFRSLEEARQTFDAQEIPADILCHNIKRLGFKIEYFSTRTHLWKGNNNPSLIRRLLLRLIGHMNFFPFNHLGPTTIIMGSKL